MAPVAVVILCHGDDQVERVEGIKPETLAAADLVVVVLSEGRIPCLPFPGVVFRPTHGITGFNAGANRDAGIAKAQELLPGCSVVFLDGDCRPDARWLAHHIEALADGRPTLSCGSRWERCRPDPRLNSIEWDGRTWPAMFRIRDDVEVEDEDDVDGHRATWSCSLGINCQALAILQRAGEALWGSSRIFPPAFDGRWGGEDTALGAVAWTAGCRIVMLDPGRSLVEHEPHRSRATRENLDLVPSFIRDMRAHPFWEAYWTR